MNDEIDNVEEIVEDTPTEEQEEDEQLIALRKRLPNVDDETLEILLEDSKYIALNELYPFEEVLPTELPSKYLNWQLRVCEYMYKHKDLLGVKEYSENEIKITFTSDNIPNSFMNELVPYAGAVRRKIVVEETTEEG